VALRRTEARVWNAFCLGQELDLKTWDAGRPGNGHGMVMRTSRAPAVRAQVLAAMLRGDGGSLPSVIVLPGAWMAAGGERPGHGARPLVRRHGLASRPLAP